MTGLVPWSWLTIYERRHAIGICHDCNAEATSGTLCGPHRAKYKGASSRSNMRLYMERKVAGICVDCGKVPATDSVMCPGCSSSARQRSNKCRKTKDWKKRHRAYMRRWRKARTEQGLCILCNHPLQTTLYCETHRQEMRDSWKARVGWKPDPKHPCPNCGEIGHRAITCKKREAEQMSIDEYATARNDWEAA